MIECKGCYWFCLAVIDGERMAYGDCLFVCPAVQTWPLKRCHNHKPKEGKCGRCEGAKVVKILCQDCPHKDGCDDHPVCPTKSCPKCQNKPKTISIKEL